MGFDLSTTGDGLDWMLIGVGLLFLGQLLALASGIVGLIFGIIGLLVFIFGLYQHRNHYRGRIAASQPTAPAPVPAAAPAPAPVASAKHCTSCGAPNPPEARFCSKCGTAFK